MKEEYPWKTFFGEKYLNFSPYILNKTRTVEEIEGIKKLLCMSEKSVILDLGSGNGRIAMPLAKEGHNLFCLDGSKTAIESGKTISAQQNMNNINWILSEMADMSFNNDMFDFIINISTALGYVSEYEDRIALKKVFKYLKQGGKLLIETENRDYKIKNFNPKLWNFMGDQPVFSTRHFNSVSGRWKEVTMWYEKDKMEEAVLDIRLYTATELRGILQSIGFKNIEIYGGWNNEKLTIDSPRMLIIADK
ncbi:class I SAM-dependent methyltransferase [Virgibacillus dokdonensis]|uniref:class I SAM-dependent methyltransferase n=1 Tax=Virgibacillus dokdonensis TaxID=302167 RepID=UPI00158FED2D|nr:class I SAM-dependent methyltransferase [Virgibacillus dokdonensis]